MTQQAYGGTDDPIDDRSDDGSSPPFPDPAEMQAALLKAGREHLTQMMNELPANHYGRKMIAQVLASVDPEDAVTIEWAYGNMHAWRQEWIQTNILDAISPEVPAKTRVKLQTMADALQAENDAIETLHKVACGDVPLEIEKADADFFKVDEERIPYQEMIDTHGTRANYLAYQRLRQNNIAQHKSNLLKLMEICNKNAEVMKAERLKEADAELKARLAKEESLKWHNVIKAKVKDFLYRAINFVKKALDSGGRGDTSNDGLTEPPPAPAPAPAPAPSGQVTSGNVLTVLSENRAVDWATGIYYVRDENGNWVREDQQPSTRR
jgi:hypothetical protein